MKWYHKLYTSEDVQHHTATIKWKIRHRAGQPDIYVIALPANSDNLMDIIPAWNLMQKSYPTEDIYAIGLARGWNQAAELVRQIVQDAYQATGTVDIRGYLGLNGEEQ